MRKLKNIIRSYMRNVTIIMAIMILAAIAFIEVKYEQKRARESAALMFEQMAQVLAENQKDLLEEQEEYTRTCLHSAEIIAYIIEDNPVVVESKEELRRIAEMEEVDEIHIFDNSGRIVAGTHPEYYGYSFDSGEQMRFFKPLLTDKSLKLVQEITPNTAEGKLMQYSALWSSNGEFIVQVGMEPVSVLKATEKNELSYIFSLLRVNVDLDYYAIDENKGKIVGATVPGQVGRTADEIGFDSEKIKDGKKGFFAVIDGNRSYCVFSKIGTNYIGWVISTRVLYRSVPVIMISIAFCLLLITVIRVIVVSRYLERYVVNGIHEINKKLSRITAGNLDETVEVRSSQEFSELSSYINDMVRKLERERDFDLLTGLYNRRGLDRRMGQLFQKPEKLGVYALVMIDVDGLKIINDTYGHEKGDIYLKEIAGLIQNISSGTGIAARQGGDEFVLFLYAYETQEELLETLGALKEKQQNSVARLEEQLVVPLSFSVGYTLAKGRTDSQKLFKEADEKMYADKRERKNKKK